MLKTEKTDWTQSFSLFCSSLSPTLVIPVVSPDKSDGNLQWKVHKSIQEEARLFSVPHTAAKLAVLPFRQQLQTTLSNSLFMHTAKIQLLKSIGHCLRHVIDTFFVYWELKITKSVVGNSKTFSLRAGAQEAAVMDCWLTGFAPKCRDILAASRPIKAEIVLLKCHEWVGCSALLPADDGCKDFVRFLLGRMGWHQATKWLLFMLAFCGGWREQVCRWEQSQVMGRGGNTLRTPRGQMGNNSTNSPYVPCWYCVFLFPLLNQ